MTGRDVSLYFHIPFCTQKCPYCHFFVLPDKTPFKEQFLRALSLEWELRLPQLQDKRIVSIYFGGGTPSRLLPAQILSILEQVLPLEIAPDCEITLEMNPEDATLDRIRGYLDAGINRISLGIQSLDDSELETLERRHCAAKALQAITHLADAGCTNISIDLMYDLPSQTLASWEKTLRQLPNLPLQHLSLYNLTLEPHTPFFKRRQTLLLPSPETSLQQLQLALDTLPQLGLERYEISAFARPGYPSRHNTGYWTARPFLGFGPSAFSYWNGARFRNVAHLNRYTQALERQQLPTDFTETLAYPHNLAELLAIHLRLLAGVDLPHFQQRHGPLSPEQQQTLHSLTQKGWLESSGSHIKLTPTGQLFYDTVASELM